MGQAAGMPAHVANTRQHFATSSYPVQATRTYPRNCSVTRVASSRSTRSMSIPHTSSTTHAAVIVPLQYYPNNVYSSGTSLVSRIDNGLNELNERITDALDDNRFYNAVRDPTIPIPPGHFVQTQTFPYNPHYTPPSQQQSQQHHNQHHQQQQQQQQPQQHYNHSYNSSQNRYSISNDGPPPYTPSAPPLHESLYPIIDPSEIRINEFEHGPKL